MPSRRSLLVLTLFMFALVLPACASGVDSPSGKLDLVATTSIIADVVGNVAGERAIVSVLFPPGTDPHSFEPTPQDLVEISEADLFFINGLGLEFTLERVIQNAGEQVKLVEVSEGIEPIREIDDLHTDDNLAGETGDPHVWMDPNNVVIWVENIARALGELDPSNAAEYQANASSYQEQLRALDEWVLEQISQIPERNRKLVSDHLVLAYYARRYGFEQVGAAIPGFSSIAEPSAQEIAKLEDSIRSLGVQAVLVSSTANPALASRIANDTRVKIVPIYTGSLSETSGPAGTYIEMMRYNTLTIQEALK